MALSGASATSSAVMPAPILTGRLLGPPDEEEDTEQRRELQAKEQRLRHNQLLAQREQEADPRCQVLLDHSYSLPWSAKKPHTLKSLPPGR